MLWEDGEPLLQEGGHLDRHLVQIMNVRVRVHITEAGSDRVIDEKQVRKLIPATIVHGQCPIFLHSIRSNLHHRAVHATATRASIQPDNGSLAVRDVSVLVEPEEHVAVVFRCDLYMSSVHVE